ncbi:MAG TPA: WecB/TagA/CpsF family glycosyltransferase [Burkholderiales bacterium]|jgi:N-acetylglucosaminyldiphosphoundecaprenol N-acetyl-beta-D-mannosaminyltransferase|nr:WecB/TagA/CpsF family glycosyltransferase [Burkholderiales bacterium]
MTFASETPVQRRGACVLGAFIDALNWDQALGLIQGWAQVRAPRSVCCCNAHSLVTMQRDPEVREAIGAADLAVPDGMPVAWMLRKLGYAGQPRLNGPDLMWRYCELAQREGTSIFLYGNRDEVLQALHARLAAAFPRLRVAGMIAPPFRRLSAAEDEAAVARINHSGAGVVFVSLGCPKQEMWMDAHRERIMAVQIGVGAAFDYHAGTLRRAPLWMQRRGMEWLHRLCTEPRRLWRRYFFTNFMFMLGAGRQLLGGERVRG